MLSRFLADHQSWRKSETVVAVCALVWGVAVLLPYETFGPDTSYRLMVGDESFWGLAFVTMGLIRLIAAEGKHHTLRRVGSLLGVGFWSVLGVFFYLGNPTTAVGGVLIMLALASVVQYLSGSRCVVDADGICNGEAEVHLKLVAEKIKELAIPLPEPLAEVILSKPKK